MAKFGFFNKNFLLCGSGGFFQVNLFLKSSNVTLFLNPDFLRLVVQLKLRINQRLASSRVRTVSVRIVLETH